MDPHPNHHFQLIRHVEGITDEVLSDTKGSSSKIKTVCPGRPYGAVRISKGAYLSW